MRDSPPFAERIYVIIPVLNRWHQTKTCLQHLKSSTHKNFEVIIVDHGSTDGTAHELHKLYPEVIHIIANMSLWWSGATNIGIREAIKRGAKTIMLLNNDCYVTPDAIEKLAAHSARAGGSVVAPVQRSYQTGRLFNPYVTTCFLLGFPTLAAPWRAWSPPHSPEIVPVKLIIGGRGTLVPVSVFEKIGILDEINLPHYGADHDFYLRCQKHGIPLYISTDATVHVDEVRSTLASKLGQLNFKQFMDSLTNRRSHRNIHDLRNLFKKHYPIKNLYMLGVGLNFLRYAITYIWKRLSAALRPKRTHET